MPSNASSGAIRPGAQLPARVIGLSSEPILSESTGPEDKNKPDLDANIAACRAKCRIVVDKTSVLRYRPRTSADLRHPQR